MRKRLALSDTAKLELITHSAAETRELGECLGGMLRPGQVVALCGPLGAGKTCLAQGIARGLGVVEPVTSPTFIIVNQYRAAGSVTLYHIDCYRLAEQGTAEALAIGVDELLDGEGICVVEWAERIAPLLPSHHMRLELAPADHELRLVSIDAKGTQYAGIVDRLDAWRHRGATAGDLLPQAKAPAL